METTGRCQHYGAGITPLRIMNDLHDKTYREAFDKRLAGEEVDYKGNFL